LGRRGGPGAFQAAGDRVTAVARAQAVPPAEALMLDVGPLGLAPDVLGLLAGAVGLAERMTAGDQRDGLRVVHRHAAERLADVARRGDRIRVAVGALRVDVDEAHLDRAQRTLELAVPGVALVREPLGLGAPVDVGLGLPDVLAPAAEPEGLEPHGLERDVAREDQEVGPRDLAAVLLLDRPDQPARLVEVGVIRPAVLGREALAAAAGATSTIADAVRAG